MRRWYAILRCEATTITRERTYQDARDRDILFWWCESMSLFFYDVCLSSTLKLVFGWNSRWRKNCRFCSCKNLFFFSPLLHSLCTFYLLSLRSTIADDDEKRRERKTIVSWRGCVSSHLFMLSSSLPHYSSGTMNSLSPASSVRGRKQTSFARTKT